ncbi:MAG TPA: prepilin-type N-terminal cleavage/methylation domain-containing protein [Blastocatellia bacterium]|jgi:prepilin-type N-terminal cleavage/methylation domain-containing protein|nr:prepilin-type N-terminal cleavage/methylation domain-containing protein [Blastocatellia bacterium]
MTSGNNLSNARLGSEIRNSKFEIRNFRSGFSLVELLIVIAVMGIMTVIAIFALRSSKRSYAPDDEANQIVSFFREAHQRAISQRQTQRVTIDRANLVVRLMDEGLLPGGDEVEIIRGKLNGTVAMTQPSISGTLMPQPPAPYGYNPAVFSAPTATPPSLAQYRFRADGSVVDSLGNSVSATFYFTPVDMNNSSQTLVRAVTLFGPSGSTRAWKYDGTQFITGAL